jgi:hypothetical protein
MAVYDHRYLVEGIAIAVRVFSLVLLRGLDLDILDRTMVAFLASLSLKGALF